MQPSTDLIPIDVDSPPLPSGASQLPTTIACLVRPVPSITRGKLHNLPVMQNSILISRARRMDFMDIYLSPYGRDLPFVDRRQGILNLLPAIATT